MRTIQTVTPQAGEQPTERSVTRPLWAPRRIDVAMGMVLFIVASVVFLRATETVPFHGDESEWINNGRYFRFMFLDRDYSSSVWRVSWVNRDQPPVGRYIIGGIIWATGRDPSKVNRSYAWERDLEANRQEGRIPGPELLMPVRRTMAVFGAFAVVLLFVAGRMIGGTITGATAAVFAIASPLLQLYFAQARTETLLALFTVTGLVLLLAFARWYRQTGRLPSFGWAIGPVMGVALATKLTAAVGILGICAYAGVAGLARFRRSRTEAVRMIAWSLTTGILASIVWVVVNPFLWPDPVGRTLSMFELQRSMMDDQGANFGHPVPDDLSIRLTLMVVRTFVEISTPPFDAGLPKGSDSVSSRTFTELPTVLGVSVELALALLGLAVLIARAAAGWRAGDRHGAETALLWWLAAYILGIGVNLNLDWPRYYVPTAFFGALLIGLGVQTLVDAALRLRTTTSAVDPATGPQPTAASPTGG